MVLIHIIELMSSCKELHIFVYTKILKQEIHIVVDHQAHHLEICPNLRRKYFDEGSEDLSR